MLELSTQHIHPKPSFTHVYTLRHPFELHIQYSDPQPPCSPQPITGV